MKPMWQAFILALCALLSACGGGSDSGTGQTPPSSTPGVVTAVAPVTVVPAATLATEESAAYQRLNTERQRCGVGLLQQNTQLDQAAFGHAHWMIANGGLSAFSHTQTVGSTAFTGVTPGDRMLGAGYNYLGYVEIMSAPSSPSKTALGEVGMRGLLSAPYHLAGAMGGQREVGVSVRSAGATGSGADETPKASGSFLVVDMGYRAALPEQLPAASAVTTYPCTGTTGVNSALYGEIPNPVPGRDLSVHPIGHPILVQLRRGRTLAITAVTVTGPSGTVALLPTMTSANDPNGHLASHQAIIMPNLPMATSSSYTVVVNGTNNGVAFSTSFSFTTGTV